MSLPAVTLIEAMSSQEIWARWFRDPATWTPWRVFIKALFGLLLADSETTLFHQCTGLDEPPAGGVFEAWLICGRRAGKSFVLALIAVFLACFRDWRPYLSPGEVGTIKILATDRRQARTIYRYCRALIAGVPVLAALIERESDDEILLTNGIAIEIQSASFRSSRGYTLIGGLIDEVAFLRSDDTAANPDEEILSALRPAMATIPGACASSPYARRGALWNAYRRWHGKAGAPLVWRASTRTMNSTVPQRVIDEERERDPARAAAEYDAEFRTDIETFIAREVIEGSVVADRHELPRMTGMGYFGFADPSGGSSDSFALGVCHRDKNGFVIVDCVRERRPPFSPENVVQEFSNVLKDYGLHRVAGDHYGGEWPREQFRKHGIEYVTSEKTKSTIYLESLPLLNSGKVELLDNSRLVVQICGLERRTARGGRDSIDHAPGAHDDLANACLGAVVLAASRAGPIIITDAMLARARMRPNPAGYWPRTFGGSAGDWYRK